MKFKGFIHEHQRNDRDDYINVDYEEIQQAEKDDYLPKGTLVKNYWKCNRTKFGKTWGCRTPVGKYDTGSITHYGKNVGTLQPREVISAKKGACGPNGCKFGQRMELSPRDINDIAELYKCGGL